MKSRSIHSLAAIALASCLAPAHSMEIEGGTFTGSTAVSSGILQFATSAANNSSTITSAGTLDSGRISVNFTSGLTKSVTGTLLLSGTNTYSGSTIVSSGTVTSAASITNAAGTLVMGSPYSGLNTGSITLRANSGINIGTALASATILKVGAAGGATTFKSGSSATWTTNWPATTVLNFNGTITPGTI